MTLCNNLLRQIHAILLEGKNGQEKNPGEFRHTQNLIGTQGSTLSNAQYIPPSPDDMTDAMSGLEKYINSDGKTDVLIRAALIHYQFETIHPFPDGNGRIGRLLIILFLMEKKVLSSPVLYISYFLKRYRAEYYDRLREVRKKGDYEQWIRFFLHSVIESAEDAIGTIDKLTALHDKNVNLFSGMGRAGKNAMLVFNYAESGPVIEIQKTSKALDLAFNTVSAAVTRLTDAGILVKTSDNSRNRTFAYKEYLDILRSGA